MKIHLDRTGDTQTLSTLLSSLDADPAVQSLLVLACDENGFTPDNLDALLKGVKKPLFGGVFPQILHQQERLTRGTLVLGLPFPTSTHCIPGLSQATPEVDAQLALHFADRVAYGGTMFVFVDGFSAHISALIEGLYNHFGLDMNYLGGGGGSLSLVQKPCVFSNQGLIQDSAVLALADLPSGIGVAHGWLPVSDAFKVTEVDGNVIRSLDWRPAFQVYREVVEGHSGRRFEEEEFFAIAKAYPFGMARLGAEMVVRDPLMRQDDALVCVGEVPRGSYVHVLHGDTASLLAAATQARGLAEEAYGDRPAHARLFVDCISLVLFLEQDFQHELKAVAGEEQSGETVPTVGVLSIGEIANNGQEFIEFYNKTAVVGLL